MEAASAPCKFELRADKETWEKLVVIAQGPAQAITYTNPYYIVPLHP
jgi:hypothetical protein